MQKTEDKRKMIQLDSQKEEVNYDLFNILN